MFAENAVELPGRADRLNASGRGGVRCVAAMVYSRGGHDADVWFVAVSRFGVWIRPGAIVERRAVADDRRGGR
jgi:hypothetical protein